MNHRNLIARKGGIRPLARKLGHQYHTTVQGWYERDNIPAVHLTRVSALPDAPLSEARAA